MKISTFFLGLGMMLLVGCNQPTLKLDPKWEPLEQVVEAPDPFGVTLVAPGVTTTIDHTSYVNNLSDWLVLYPNGSVEQEALLRHESLHAKRENAYPEGVTAWLARYVADRDFRWQEEKAGWAEELTWLVKYGRYIDKVEVATILNENYGPVGGRMVSYADAYAFVDTTVNAAYGY